MKARFNYDDIVRIQPSAGLEGRASERAWVVGVFENRPEGGYFDKFPEGIVYSVEFEDGSSTEVHESDLRLDESGQEITRS